MHHHGPNWFALDCVPAAQSKKISPQDVLVKRRMAGDFQRFLPMLFDKTSATDREA
jgi:hypothetical protein